MFNFPNAPILNEEFTPVGGPTYIWTGTTWDIMRVSSGADADLLDGQDGTYYLARANHTGTQAISTVTGLQSALDAKPDSTTGKFNQALTGSPWENITVGGNTGRIHRMADRLMVADGIQYTGTNGPSGTTGTWLASDGAGSTKMDYLSINAGLASI